MTTDHAAQVWRSRAGDTPASLAALFEIAAGIIRTQGYDACEASGPYEGGEGVSVCTALRLAAQASSQPGPDALNPLDVADLTGELETRLAGYLYLTGQRAGGSIYRQTGDQVAAWELDLGPAHAWKTAAEALAVLDGIAATLAAIGGGR